MTDLDDWRQSGLFQKGSTNGWHFSISTMTAGLTIQKTAFA